MVLRDLSPGMGAHSHHLDILGQTGLIGAGLQFIFMALAGLLYAYIAIIFGNFMYHFLRLI